MTGFLEYEDGHIFARHNGRVALDTRAPMLFTVPAAAFTLEDYTIEFPDLWKGTLYQQHRETTTFGEYNGCATFVAPVPQEWGPDKPSPCTLPDILIGTVPKGTDYLEIWVNLARTVAPAKMTEVPMATDFPEGLWVLLDGHSCVLEEFLGVARQLEFVLSGTNVFLRRRQSVNDGSGGIAVPGARETGGASLGNKTFFFPGANAPVVVGGRSLFGQKIDSKLTFNGPTHRPPGYEGASANNVPCSMNHAGISYASVWSGTFKITPGFIDA